MRKGKRRSATALSLIALIVTTLLLGSCLSLSQSLELLASDTFSEGFMDRYQEAILRASAKAAAEAAQPLSPREEYYIGRAVAARVFSLYGLYDAPELTDYLNKLGQGLALFSSRPEIYAGYRFAVLDSQEVNAFASPGGHILITRGLLSKVESEDELAAVLAHEIAHVALRHGLVSIQGSRLAQIAAKYALSAGLASGGELASFTEAFGEAISELATVLLISGYSQGFELQADREAKRILFQASYDPCALDRLIAKLPSPDQAPSGFAQTHPKPSFRIEALNDILIAPVRASDLLANPMGPRPGKRYWPNPRPEVEGRDPGPNGRSHARRERFAAIRGQF
ncbi:Beta-barrel assembly-enhancing protease [bioreactor metagenome]|jgi:predicted Zn-dependent protease|uniref:Peptidase M48, Ste24p n=2 Tax=root TaxID=1 RepID=A0A652ZS27_9SPIR|nr:M48 family metallopeptidase [Spirochaetales bacterium]VBB38546.1 Peptidase M48, Ste24p [uncultured Spirochaetota bacterium]